MKENNSVNLEYGKTVNTTFMISRIDGIYIYIYTCMAQINHNVIQRGLN